MLETMRKHAGSWMVKIIFIVIIVVFSFWGIEGYRERTRNILAKVNGDEVTILEFKNSYDNLINMLKERYKDSFSDELIKTLNLKEKVMDDMIEKRLIIKEGERLKIKITEDDVKNYIANN